MLPNISAGRKSELGFTPVLALAKLGKSTVQGLYLQEQPKLVFFACVSAGGRQAGRPGSQEAGQARQAGRLEFLLRTLAAGIVLTEYFPAVDDGVVTDGEYEVPRRSLTGPSAFGESQEGSPKSTLERPSGSVIGGA